MLNVGADGAGAEVEVFDDLGRLFAIEDQEEDLFLSRCQDIVGLCGGFVFEQLHGQLVGDVFFAFGDFTDRGDDLRDGASFGQVCGGTFS